MQKSRMKSNAQRGPNCVKTLSGRVNHENPQTSGRLKRSLAWQSEGRGYFAASASYMAMRSLTRLR